MNLLFEFPLNNLILHPNKILPVLFVLIMRFSMTFLCFPIFIRIDLFLSKCIWKISFGGIRLRNVTKIRDNFLTPNSFYSF